MGNYIFNSVVEFFFYLFTKAALTRVLSSESCNLNLGSKHLSKIFQPLIFLQKLNPKTGFKGKAYFKPSPAASLPLFQSPLILEDKSVL